MQNSSVCFKLMRSSYWNNWRVTSRRRWLRFESLEQRTMLAVNVVPTVETSADAGEEDDIAIWIHPTDTSLSRVIGTVKTSASSLRVYNLQGQQVQSISVANVNNIDLRYNFQLSGEPATIVAGSNRSNNSIVLYKVDPLTGQLQNVAARTISTGVNVYGCTMYVSPTTGKYYVFISSESGQVQQWELFDNGAGKVDATQVRSFSVGSQSEGLVADDGLSYLYVGEEGGGIWKYSAEPTSGSTRIRVDTTGSGGHLTADVEGLAIYYAANGAGYLIASSQGNDEFAVYQRGGSNTYVNSFKLIAGSGIDAVTDTDGIDVTNFPLGNEFSQGMFIAQDNNENFKFVRWEAIDAAFGGSLITDTTWDPRVIGMAPDPNVSHGDYNLNENVDAADYVVWRKLLGTTGVPEYFSADGDGDTTIEPDDYDVWEENFGEVLPPPGAGAASAVLTMTDPVVGLGEAVAPLSVQEFAAPVEAKVGATSRTHFTMIEGRAARHNTASPPRERNTFFRADKSANDKLLLALAIDRVGRTPRQSASVVDFFQNEDHPDSVPDLQCTIEDTLDVDLAEWR